MTSVPTLGREREGLGGQEHAIGCSQRIALEHGLAVFDVGAQRSHRASAADFGGDTDRDDALAPALAFEADDDVPLIELQLVQRERAQLADAET